MIYTELVKLIPAAGAIFGVCFLMLVVSLATRYITIKHYLRYHLDDITREQLNQKEELINDLVQERKQLNDKYEKQAVMLRGVRGAVSLYNENIEELEVVK